MEKTLVACIDGLDARFLDWVPYESFCGAYWAKTLGRNIAGSAYECYSPTAWSTFATGQPPEVHGAARWLAREPWNRNTLKVKPLLFNMPCSTGVWRLLVVTDPPAAKACGVTWMVNQGTYYGGTLRSDPPVSRLGGLQERTRWDALPSYVSKKAALADGLSWLPRHKENIERDSELEWKWLKSYLEQAGCPDFLVTYTRHTDFAVHFGADDTEYMKRVYLNAIAQAFNTARFGGYKHLFIVSDHGYFYDADNDPLLPEGNPVGGKQPKGTVYCNECGSLSLPHGKHAHLHDSGYVTIADHGPLGVFWHFTLDECQRPYGVPCVEMVNVLPTILAIAGLGRADDPRVCQQYLTETDPVEERLKALGYI